MVHPSRRQFLGMAGSSAGLSLWNKNSRKSEFVGVDPQFKRESTNAGLFTEFPGYPDDPFIITEFGAQYFNDHDSFGWVPETPREEHRTVLGLHPDVLELNPLTVFKEGQIQTKNPGQLKFALNTGLPATAGWNINIKTGEKAQRYEPIMQKYGWSYPNGDPLDSPADILARKFDGTPQYADYTDMGVPSVFAPGYLDLLVEVTSQRLEQGFSGIWIDDIVYFRRYGLDFSPWAISAFQDHLTSLSDTRLSELGVDQPASFNIKQYLQAENLTPDSGNDPRNDPIFREYQLHHHLGIKSLFASLRQAIKDRFPERTERNEIKFYGNLGFGVGGDTLGTPDARAPGIYSNDYFELINTELFPTVRSHSQISYKLLLAFGKYHKLAKTKSTIHEAPGYGRDREGFDPEKHYPMLQRFQAAEAYAMGVIQKLPLTTITFEADDAITQWIRGDGSVSKPLQTFNDFLWAHRRFLTDTELDNPVAVIFSLPDRIWHFIPQWDIETQTEQPRLDSFTGTGIILDDAQIPYDTLVFGHPQLWDDTEQLDRLQDYKTVVLPSIGTLTKSQASALQEYLSQGGTLIVSGEPPARTAMYRPGDQLTEIFDHENVTILESDPGRQRITRGTTDGSLRKGLQESGITSATVNETTTVSVNRTIQSDPSRLIVHVLNREYSRETDSFTRRQNIRLRVSKPDWEIGAARYYSPRQIRDVDVKNHDTTVTVDIPELTEWGFVVFAPSHSDLTAADAENNASDRVQTARNAIKQAQAANRDWSLDFVTAEVKLNAADTALDYRAYEQATEAANEAIKAVEKAHRQPTIAIDQSHGQSASQEFDAPFAWLRDEFPSYQYTTIPDWSDQVLEEVDVLFVPPALRFKNTQHGFMEAEVDQIESFVANGGSLVILARGGVADDIDMLTERFGFQYHGQPIVYPENAEKYAETLNWRHQLTQAVSGIFAHLATPIKTIPKDATILARVAEDSPAWIDTENINKQDKEDKSAAGSPIYAVAKHGDGYVTVLGIHRYLYPNHYRNTAVVMGNLLQVLSREAVRTRDTSQSTTTPLPTDAASNETTVAHSESQTVSEPTTATDLPGFGFLAGVLGVATGLAVLRYLNSDESN